MSNKLWIIIIPVITVIVGIIGFMRGENMDFYDSLLYSLQFPKGYLDPLPVNMMLELARWLGIGYLCSMFFAAILAIINSGAVFLRSYKADAIAVHGDSIYLDKLEEGLGKKAIRTDARFAFKAPTQVIFFNNDRDTLDFYQRHSDVLSETSDVHLCLNGTYRNASVKDNVYILNIAETKAINYWRNNYINKQESVAIVGSGQLAENILYWGLQMNVFDTSKNVSYSVYGDFGRFTKLHPLISEKMLEFGGDEVAFYEKWYDHLNELSLADRIIICGETNENIEIATMMGEAGLTNETHVFIEGSGARTVFDAPNIKFAGDMSSEDIKEMILMDKIHDAGIICNITYDLYEERIGTSADLTYESVRKELDSATARKSWDSLDSFTKGSNYSSALHDVQKYDLMKAAGVDVNNMSVSENEEAFDNLSSNDKERLQEIEHIRWARYHLLNNWATLDEKTVEDGVLKNKDPERRLHINLVPYSELTREDKDKGAYFYKTLALRFKAPDCC